MKWLGLAWRNVLRNRRRTLLTTSVFATGALAILSAFGFVSASFHGLGEATIAAQLGHVQAGAPGQFAGFEHKPLDTAMGAAQVARARLAFQARPEVRFVMRRLHFEGLIAFGERTLATVGAGVEPELESRLSGPFSQVVQGQGLTAETSGDEAMEVLVAVDLARALGVKPGDQVTLMSTTERGSLNGIDVRVQGLYRTGIPELDRRAVLLPLPAAQSLLDTDKVSRLVAVLGRTDDTEFVVAAMRVALPGLEVQGWRTLAAFFNQVVTLYGTLFSVLGLIIAVVVLLSVSNVMLMSLMERVREQGTLLAIGIPASRVIRNFLLEGAIVGFLGALLGLLLSAGLSLAVNLAGIQMPPPPGRTTTYPLQIFVEPDAYAAVALGMVLLGVLAAGLSQYSIRRMSVLQKLTHT
jgi:putative ABC transport system permease protein